MRDTVIKSGEKIDCYTDWLMKKLGREIPVRQYVIPPCNRKIEVKGYWDVVEDGNDEDI